MLLCFYVLHFSSKYWEFYGTAGETSCVNLTDDAALVA